MTEKPGQIVRIYSGGGTVNIYDEDGNTITMNSGLRLWIDELTVNVCLIASLFSSGALGPLHITYSGTVSGQLYFEFAASDSVDGTSAPPTNCTQTFPGSGFPLIAGDGLLLAGNIGASSGVILSGLGRIRPANEG